MPDIVATHRLTLVPLTPALLRAVVGGDLAEVERELDAPVVAGWEQGVPAALRLKQLTADPAAQPWLVRAMVASTPRTVVGSIGFHALGVSAALGQWRGAAAVSADGIFVRAGRRWV